MTFILDAQIHMWMTFTLIFVGLYFYATDKFPIEITSIALVVWLLIWGQVFPLYDVAGTTNKLSYTKVLSGFANPYLFAIMGLLVVAQGLVQTSALSPVTRFFNRYVSERFITPCLILLFLLLTALSAFLNNTPLVVMAIPIVQALAMKFKRIPHYALMMLSFMCILGGMTTVLGSSTNMLVSNALESMGYQPLHIFGFIVPGAIMAGVGLVYLIFVMPFIVRKPKDSADIGDIYRYFIVDLPVKEKSQFADSQIAQGRLVKDKDVDLHFLTRGLVQFLNHFDTWQVRQGDVMTVSAPRDKILELLTKEGILDVKSGNHAVAEIMIPPGSRYIDTMVEFVDLKGTIGCEVVAVQRHSRHLRTNMQGLRLGPGDVLLVTGTQDAIKALVPTPDIVPIADTKTDVSYTKKANLSVVIFFATIGLAVTGTLPIAIAALLGAAAMLLAGCLNMRQFMRALDRRVYFIVGASLAMGLAIEATGAAYFIGQKLTALPFLDTPFAVCMALFVVVAVMTNLISNNATAVIFTPIALSLAAAVQADPYVFALAVLFAANCSFASPIGYQTNLLVMGPGHYNFSDFMKAGVPLVLIMAVAYAVVVRVYFGL